MTRRNLTILDIREQEFADLQGRLDPGTMYRVVDTTGRPIRTVTPDGQVVGGGVRPASNIFALRAIGNALNGSGTSTHQQRVFVPFGGEWVDVALEFYNNSTSVAGVLTGARVAPSANFNDINPTGAWQSFSTGLNVPVAVAENRPTYSRTEWVRMFVPEDAGVPGWGSIYARSRYTSGGWHYGLNSATTYAATAARFKNRNDYEAIAIDGAFSSPTENSMIRQCTVLIRPVGGLAAQTVAFFGDSRVSGQGSTSDYYGWCNRVAESIASDGQRFVGLENFGIAGTNSATFKQRFDARVRGAQIDAVYFQPASTNDTNAWEAATVEACIARTADVAAECARRGIQFVTATMYPSVAADTADKAARWAAFNETIRATYRGRVIDFAASALTDNNGSIPVMAQSLAADTPARHANDAGHILMSNLAQPVIVSAIGLTA